MVMEDFGVLDARMEAWGVVQVKADFGMVILGSAQKSKLFFDQHQHDNHEFGHVHQGPQVEPSCLTRKSCHNAAGSQLRGCCKNDVPGSYTGSMIAVSRRSVDRSKLCGSVLPTCDVPNTSQEVPAMAS